MYSVGKNEDLKLALAKGNGKMVLITVICEAMRPAN